MSSDALTMYLTVVSLIVAIASLLAAIAATWIAKVTLTQSKQVAERDRRDWAQRKWFDLYFAMTHACNMFESFQMKLNGRLPKDWEPEHIHEWNGLMLQFRTVFSMALVFPENEVIEDLTRRTLVFTDKQEALSEARLDLVWKALENIRLQSLIDSSVLARAE